MVHRGKTKLRHLVVAKKNSNAIAVAARDVKLRQIVALSCELKIKSVHTVQNGRVILDKLPSTFDT